MLNPSKDRLDYGKLLLPPDGYTFDFCIGTTYSLDLDALVSICLAMGLSEDTDRACMKDPVYILKALRDIGNRIVLFCEAGQIHAPHEQRPLYALLEQVVHQVSLPAKREGAYYPSFHPKTCLIRYVNEDDEVMYRFIVMSRNLTFDRSWDVAFYMDGQVRKRKCKKSDPLIDFVGFLRSQLIDDKAWADQKRFLRSCIMNELETTEFVIGDKEFDDFEFIPCGITGRDGGLHTIVDVPLFLHYGEKQIDDGYHDIFIMSPFLSASVIRYFNNRNRYIDENKRDYILITRKESMNRLRPEDCSSFRVFVMKDDVVNGESVISGDGGEYLHQDIHAKIYMIRYNSNAELYLGSLNASYNAINGNVEFMLCLSSKNRYLNMDVLRKSLFGDDQNGDSNPFMEVEIQEREESEDSEEDQQLDLWIKKLVRSQPYANVRKGEEGYEVRVHIDDINCPYNVRISPLLSAKSKELGRIVLFNKMCLSQLTEFYKIRVSDGQTKVERVVKIPTEIPRERDDELIRSIITDEDRFYQYLMLQLSEDIRLSGVESFSVSAEHSLLGTNHKNKRMPGLYEALMRTAANNPERLRDIEIVTRAIKNEDVVSGDFKKLYETICKAANI